MIEAITLSEIAQEVARELPKDSNPKLLGVDAGFTRLSTDTRSLQAGDGWLALVGEHYDGNDYLADAHKAGAVAAIVSRSDESVHIPQLLVKDTAAALAAAARLNRRRSSARGSAQVVALTGSQGKTTVKEMIAAILARLSGGKDAVLATKANLNNTIGVPLTLLGLEPQHRFGVIEMGANRAGEIAFSVAAAEPDIALITNASPTHVEGFGSLAGIVKAKGEIIDGVKEGGTEGGTIVLNADDPHCKVWRKRAGKRKVVTFSVPPVSAKKEPSATYFAKRIRTDRDGRMHFRLHSPLGEYEMSLNLLGRHNVRNAVAASAAAIEATLAAVNNRSPLEGEPMKQGQSPQLNRWGEQKSVTDEEILSAVSSGLATMQPVKGRLHPRPGPRGSLLLDDTYNASPAAFTAAIEVLMSFGSRHAEGSGSQDAEGSANQIVVAGDMKELGADSASAHRDLGEYAAKTGVQALWAVGEDSVHTVAGFNKAAKGDKQAKHFADKDTLLQACREAAAPGVVFLIKGSRGAKMETLVEGLATQQPSREEVTHAGLAI